jgi:HEAT repeat protein
LNVNGGLAAIDTQGISCKEDAMMTRHENVDPKQPPFFIRRPALGVITMLAMLFFTATMLNCAGHQQGSPLHDRLLSSDERTKQSAFKEFDSLKPASKRQFKYLDIMKSMLHDADPNNQVLAADAVGHMGPDAEELVPDLVQLLTVSNETVRSHAGKSLTDLGVVAVPSLILALKQPEPAMRVAAADTLGNIGPAAKEAIPDLATMLGDEDHEISRHAASALGHIGPAAVPELIEVARWRSRYTTDMASTAFASLKADDATVRGLVQLMGNVKEDPGVRAFAAKALGYMPEKALSVQPEIIRAMGDENNDVRTSARWALGQIGPKAIPALKEALKDSNPRIRSGAAFALGSIGPAAEEAVPDLLRVMKDDDRTVRIDAILAIGKTQVTSYAVVRALIQVLDTDKDEVVRLDAVRVLSKMESSEAEEAVSKFNKSNVPK